MADNNNDVEKIGNSWPMFICIRCHTQFASPQQVRGWNFILRGILISQPYFNLNIQPQQYLCGTSLTAYVSCIGCNMVMGYKFIHEYNPNHACLQGLVVLYLSLLCFWNGEVIYSLMVPLPMHLLPLPPPPRGQYPPFFMCKACNTHVGCMQGLLTINMENRIFFFSNCMQLAVDPPEHHYMLQNGTLTLAFVKCRRCNAVLGMKIVRKDDPAYRFRQGNIGLYMTRLKIWNGIGASTHSAMTIGFHVFSAMQRFPTPGQMLNQERLPSP